MEHIELEIADIKSAQHQSDAFALVMKEKGGKRQFPVIIGLSEARAIALQFNTIKPLRPTTHDLFSNFADKCGYKVKNVEIVNYSSGIFYSSIVMADAAGSEIALDSRTSDAVTLALKYNAPIIIGKELFEKIHTLLAENNAPKSNTTEEQPVAQNDNAAMTNLDDDKYMMHKLREMPLEELQDMLDGAIECEEYEMASKIKEELERRKS